MRNFQSIVFKWTRTYGEIFKSALFESVKPVRVKPYVRSFLKYLFVVLFLDMFPKFVKKANLLIIEPRGKLGCLKGYVPAFWRKYFPV